MLVVALDVAGSGAAGREFAMLELVLMGLPAGCAVARTEVEELSADAGDQAESIVAVGA